MQGSQRSGPDLSPPAHRAADPEHGSRIAGIPGVRRLLHLTWRITRGMTLGVRGAVIDAQDRVLLVRHTYVQGWHMPGGGVEPAESALEALRRELAEEAAVVWTGTPLLHGVFFNRVVSERDHVLVYRIRDFTIPAPKRPDREIAEVRWFPLDALPKDATRGMRERLVEMTGQRPISTDW